MIGCCTGIKACAQHYSRPLESVALNIGKSKWSVALFKQVNYGHPNYGTSFKLKRRNNNIIRVWVGSSGRLRDQWVGQREWHRVISSPVVLCQSSVAVSSATIRQKTLRAQHTNPLAAQAPILPNCGRLSVHPSGGQHDYNWWRSQHKLMAIDDNAITETTTGGQH